MQEEVLNNHLSLTVGKRKIGEHFLDGNVNADLIRGP